MLWLRTRQLPDGDDPASDIYGTYCRPSYSLELLPSVARKCFALLAGDYVYTNYCLVVNVFDWNEPNLKCFLVRLIMSRLLPNASSRAA